MHLSLLPTFLRDPVVPPGIVLSEFLSLCLGEYDRERNRHRAGHYLWRSHCLCCVTDLCLCWLWLLVAVFLSEQSGQMSLHGCSRLDRKARSERIQVGVSVDLRAINVQLSTPDQLLLLALLNDGVEEALEHLHAIAFSDTCQAGMIR